MEEGFIKNYDILEESYKVDALIDISDITQGFKTKLESISKPSIIGLIGKFGSGKSTMLYQIEKEYEKDNLWVNFDAWKYPDRKEMWEGLLIEISEVLGKRKDIISKIDGKETAESKRINTYSDIAAAFTGLPVFKSISEIYNRFHDNSPMKRLYEMQDLFKTMLSETKSDIYLVLEDIDRSGDYGLYLLETLKQFISTLSVEKRIMVIVPIGNKQYSDNIDAYLKCLDYVEYFQMHNISLDNLFENLIKNDLLGRKVSNSYLISEIFEYIFKQQPEFSVRMMKTILRKADMNYQAQIQDGYQPKWMWTVVFELSKYIEYGTEGKYFSVIRNNKSLTNLGNFTIFVTSIDMGRSIYVNRDRNKLHSEARNIKLIPTNEYNIKYERINELTPNIDDRGTVSFGIYDYYINY